MVRWAAAVVVFVVSSTIALAEAPFRYPEGKHGKGELCYRNGLCVLVVSGSPAEIGEQIGALALKPIAARLRAQVKEAVEEKVGVGWPLLVGACQGLFRRFPEDLKTELEAMSKASRLDREVLVVANTIADIQHLGGCSGIIVEPSRSSTGQLIFGRNMDTAPIGDLPSFGLVIIRRPTGKHAFASVTFPGLLMGGSEMNDAGLCIGGNDVRKTKDGSPKLSPKGTPMAMAGRRLMEDCANLDDADKVLRGLEATTTGNAVMCDTKHGRVYEVTPKHVVARPAEDGYCGCTNHFLTRELSVGEECWRYKVLEKYFKSPKLSLAEVKKGLDEVNQDKCTLHSMVFEPAALRLHVAIGPGPATRHSYRTLECGPLFNGEPGGK
jgi:hypothetical protein